MRIIPASVSVSLLAAVKLLCRRKGYTFLGTNTNGVNAFFVRDESGGSDRRSRSGRRVPRRRATDFARPARRA